MTTVVDASAYLDLLLDVVPEPDRRHFAGDLAVPDLFLVELASGLASCQRRGLIEAERAALMLTETLSVPFDVVPSSKLVERAFELRGYLSIYDACYVALAEQRRCGVLTSDRRLAHAPGIGVRFTVI
jgi:predicted nucleic acid-binding protein